MVNSSAIKLISAFILLIIGIMLLTQVAAIGSGVTSKTVIEDEVIDYTTAFSNNASHINISVGFTIANPPTSWKVDDCPLTGITLTNSSGTVWTSGTDYSISTTTGAFTLRDTVKVNTSTTNNTYIDYQYCGDDYINLSWGRTGINLVPGFFALTMLLISIGLFYSVAKEEGIIK